MFYRVIICLSFIAMIVTTNLVETGVQCRIKNKLFFYRSFAYYDTHTTESNKRKFSMMVGSKIYIKRLSSWIQFLGLQYLRHKVQTKQAMNVSIFNNKFSKQIWNTIFFTFFNIFTTICIILISFMIYICFCASVWRNKYGTVPKWGPQFTSF